MVEITCTLLTCLTIAVTLIFISRLTASAVVKINKANHEHELKLLELKKAENPVAPSTEEKLPEPAAESEAATFLQILANPDVLMEEFDNETRRDSEEV